MTDHLGGNARCPGRVTDIHDRGLQRESNNALVSQIASQYSNVRVIDWNSISNGHPEYFAPDGVHLVPTGISVYVDAIVSELE